MKHAAARQGSVQDISTDGSSRTESVESDNLSSASNMSVNSMLLTEEIVDQMQNLSTDKINRLNEKISELETIPQPKTLLINVKPQHIHDNDEENVEGVREKWNDDESYFQDEQKSAGLVKFNSMSPEAAKGQCKNTAVTVTDTVMVQEIHQLQSNVDQLIDIVPTDDAEIAASDNKRRPKAAKGFRIPTWTRPVRSTSLPVYSRYTYNRLPQTQLVGCARPRNQYDVNLTNWMRQQQENERLLEGDPNLDFYQ